MFVPHSSHSWGKQESACTSTQRTINPGLELKGEGGQNRTSLLSEHSNQLGSQMSANKTYRTSSAV